MRMIRYMAWVLVASSAFWSLGCGSGASAPDSGDITPEMQQKIDEGNAVDPNLAPKGQVRFKGEKAPEQMSEQQVDGANQ